MVFSGLFPALCAAQLPRFLRTTHAIHLTKTDIGNVEGTSPFVLVQFRRDDCPWCKRFSQDVLPEFRCLYVDTGQASVSQVGFGLKPSVNRC